MATHRPQPDRLAVRQWVSLLVALLHVQVAVPLSGERQALGAVLAAHISRHLRKDVTDIKIGRPAAAGIVPGLL